VDTPNANPSLKLESENNVCILIEVHKQKTVCFNHWVWKHINVLSLSNLCTQTNLNTGKRGY
jgi:hypothetical protein